MAETTLPEPLVPAEVDLRNFLFMPLEVGRLRRSKSWLIAKRNPEIGFYMLNVWMGVWHNIPAGSLEDDDDVIADMAMCDPRRWDRVKADVMRGWIKCSDGRLYHPVVAEKVRDSWEVKVAQRKRTAAATEARRKRDAQSNDDATNTVTSDVTETVTKTRRKRDGHRDDNATSTKGREEKGREDLSLASGDKSPSAAAKPREDALCQPAGISDGDLTDSVETVFSAVVRSAENWFDAVERDRHDGDEVVIRGWLELAGSAGLSDADAVQAIAKAIDRQFERLSKRPRVGMPVSLELIDKDVRAAVSAARRNPSKVADEARAPEPYAARFTATQWTMWLKPCTVFVEDGVATITAPTLVVADRLRVHHDQDLRVCLDVDTVDVVVSARRKGASAKIIPHPAVAEASK